MEANVALPVAIDVTGPHAQGLRRTVEGVLGWQVVDDATGRYMPPTVRLVDTAADPTDDTVACVLVVAPDDEGPDVARAMAQHGALGSVAWPCDAQVLADSVGRVADRPGRAGAGRMLRVGGASGGVGTTTLTLAIAGLAAWRGSAVLAAVRGDAPVDRLREVASGASGSPDLYARANAVDGVPGARAVRIDGGPFDTPVDDAIDLTVVDERVDVDVDVLVARPDRRGVECIGLTTASAIVVNGDGPVPDRELARHVQGRRALRLPTSARVAHADLRKRVPAALPGSWLRPLAGLVTAAVAPGESSR